MLRTQNEVFESAASHVTRDSAVVQRLGRGTAALKRFAIARTTLSAGLEGASRSATQTVARRVRVHRMKRENTSSEDSPSVATHRLQRHVLLPNLDFQSC